MSFGWIINGVLLCLLNGYVVILMDAVVGLGYTAIVWLDTLGTLNDFHHETL